MDYVVNIIIPVKKYSIFTPSFEWELIMNHMLCCRLMALFWHASKRGWLVRRLWLAFWPWQLGHAHPDTKVYLIDIKSQLKLPRPIVLPCIDLVMVRNVDDPHILVDLNFGVGWDTLTKRQIQRLDDSHIRRYRFLRSLGDRSKVYFAIRQWVI